MPVGAMVCAIAAGRVTHADAHPAWPARGNYVTVDHGNGYVSFYLHLSDYLVNVGDEVMAGEGVGYSGNSGQSTGPHLHLGLHREGVGYVDPAPLLGLE